MKRKVIGFVAALVLASIGTLALVAYVRSARDEAVAGEELVDVFVLDRSLDKGASANEIRDALRREQVPSKVRASDAITDPSVIGDGTVAAVRLEAGEQLLQSRLVGEETLTRLAVPDGLQEMTIALEPERAIGGELRPGDTVGVVLSFEPFALDAGGQTPTTIPGDPTATSAPADGVTETTVAVPDETPNMTHLALHKVLVTQVQFVESTSSSENENGPDDVGTAPSTDVLVTLALSANDVEQVVFAAEFGRVWLTSENGDADESGTRIVTLGEALDIEAVA